MRRRLAIIVVFVLAYLLWPSADLSPEDKIRASVNDAAEATRRGHAGDFMDEISESFADPRFSRKSLHGMLLREFLNGGGTAVHLEEVDVVLEPDERTATVSVVASFPGAFLETTLKATKLMFTLDYALEGDEWRIVSQINSASE